MAVENKDRLKKLSAKAQGNKDIATKVIKEMYPGITQDGIDAVLRNIGLETSFSSLNGQEIAWDNAKFDSAGNRYKKIKDNYKEYLKTNTKADYANLSNDDKLSVMYWGKTGVKYAGGYGALQITSSAWTIDNSQFQSYLDDVSSDMGITSDELFKKLKEGDFEAGTRFSLAYYTDKGWSAKKLNNTTATKLRYDINPGEKFEISDLPDNYTPNVSNQADSIMRRVEWLDVGYYDEESGKVVPVEGTTKLDKEVRAEIDKEIDNIYGPQIQRLKDKGFNDLAVELEKEAASRAEELKRMHEGSTDTKAITASLENERLRFLTNEQQEASKIPGRSRTRKLTDLEKAGINLSPQDGYKDVLFDKEKRDVVETNERYISELNEIIENKDDKYTFNQIRDAQASLDKLIAFNEDNKTKIAVLDNRSEKTPSPVTQEVFNQRASILKETGDVISKINDAKKVLDKKEKTEQTQLEQEEEEQKFFIGPDGKKYPYQTVEAGEEDTITTEGLIEPLDTEVELEGEPGVGKTITPLEEYELEQQKKQQRREKIANLAQGLGNATKAAGIALLAGAGLKSMHEATKEHKINKIRISPLMEEAFQKAKAMSTQGLTYAERAAAMADLNNAYAGALKNVMAISGGQRSTALANMGVVDASRVNALVDLAGKDAALRQSNMKIYQEQAANYGRMQLSADSTNEQLRAQLEEGRKARLSKIGESLFSEATEFTRNFVDQKNNKELLDQFADVKNQLAASEKETKFVFDQLKEMGLGVDLSSQ